MSVKKLEQSTLSLVRERLLPLGFGETSDLEYVDNVFRHGDFLFRWGLNYKDERFFFYLSQEKKKTFLSSGQTKSESIQGPSMWNENQSDWNDYKVNIFKALDSWLK